MLSGLQQGRRSLFRRKNRLVRSDRRYARDWREQCGEAEDFGELSGWTPV